MARRTVALPKEMNLDIDKRMFNSVYLPHLGSVHAYEVFYGGSGSGKTTFIASKLALQMSTMPGRNLVCLRTQKTDCIESCWAEMYNWLQKFHLLDYWDVKENPDHRMINRINGNTILFEGVDNIEDIKSIKFANKVLGGFDGNNLTDVWYEEVNSEKDKNTIEELDRRLRDDKVKCRIILSFNPVSRAHWLYEFVTGDLTMDGVDSLILKTTYKDNRFILDEYAQKLERYKYTSPYNYQVYTLGNWGTLGQTVFNADKVQERLNALADFKFTRHTFLYELGDNKMPKDESFKLVDNVIGDTSIFIQPIPRHPYVVAVDTSGEGSDFYAAHVMDNSTGEQVATYRSKEKPDVCIWQIYGLCRLYNDALYVPEINFDGAWTIKTFQMMDYPNIYKRTTKADKTHIRKEDRYGWRTQPDNRTMIINDMILWTSLYMHKIYDVETLNEMLTFTRQTKKLNGMWMGAEPGTHDDCFIKGTLILTDKGQIPIESIQIGDMVMTRNGYKPVVMTRNRCKKVISKLGLTGTPTHPIITKKGEKSLDIVNDSDIIYMWNEKTCVIEEKKIWNVKQLFTTEENIIGTQNQKEDNFKPIIGDMTNGKNHHIHYIGKYGLIILEKFLRDMLFITKTRIRLIIQLIILNVFRMLNIVLIICCKKAEEINQEKMEKDNQSVLFDNLQNGKRIIQKKQEKCALKTEIHKKKEPQTILKNGVKKIQNWLDNKLVKMEKNHVLKDGEQVARVYNLQVYNTPEYFANNILVHNCVMSFAILLQGREQQSMEMVSTSRKIEGECWTRGELEDAYDEGRFDINTILEYVRSKGCYGEDYSTKFKWKGM